MEVTGLAWPVSVCEACGFDITTKDPKPQEKTFDIEHRKTWHDHCPKCGKGYQVGFREDVVRHIEPGGVAEEAKGNIVNLQPGTDIEESIAVPDSEPAPTAVDTLPETMYFCTKCTKNHMRTSRLGKKHLKYQE